MNRDFWIAMYLASGALSAFAPFIFDSMPKWQPAWFERASGRLHPNNYGESAQAILCLALAVSGPVGLLCVLLLALPTALQRMGGLNFSFIKPRVSTAQTPTQATAKS